MVLGHDEDGGLRITLKPDGSAQITVGDEVIDGTVASRMEQARRAVLG